MQGKGVSPIPSSYIAAWFVQQSPVAASTALGMRHHTEYQNPSFQGPAHLNTRDKQRYKLIQSGINLCVNFLTLLVT